MNTKRIALLAVLAIAIGIAAFVGGSWGTHPVKSAGSWGTHPVSSVN